MSTTAPRRIAVWVLVPPRALLLDIAGPLEVLRRANVEQSQIEFDVRYIGVRRKVTSSIGLALGGIKPLPRTLAPSTLLVLGGNVDSIAFGTPPAAAEVERDERAIVTWLAKHVREEHCVISICAGALLAARAGLLDGRACTTHHTACAELAALAPRAQVIENRLYVEDGNRWSSAGVTAGTDLMLHLVARMTSGAVALAIARHLVVYLRRSGSDPQLSPWLEGRNHLHPAVHRAQDAIAANPAQAWTLETLARLSATSSRHLSRLFNEHTGMSLPDYVNRLRVSLARELLGHTRLDMERVAERSGFASARQLRRAWRRSYPTPPQDARAKDANLPVP
jgi:transcriptional regulator GlxA family with amidase domain